MEITRPLRRLCGLLLVLASSPSAVGVAGIPGSTLPPVTADSARTAPDAPPDNPPAAAQRLLHRLEMDGGYNYTLPTTVFTSGLNQAGKPIRHGGAVHLDYGVQLHPRTAAARAYADAYQGVGIARYRFDNPRELGNAWAVYAYQGARLARLTRTLTFYYRWNFGLSWGWHPFDVETSPYNRAHGSPVNAYLDAQLLLRWAVSPRLDLTAGATFAHFSNGSTSIPNAGLNTLGLRVGMAYTFRPPADTATVTFGAPVVPRFRRHWSWDAVAFGSWRQRGYVRTGKKYVLNAKYAVAGFSVAPMYNTGYRFRVGAGLDAVYDASGNRMQIGDDDELHLVPGVKLRQQLALGLSGRAEYVMPWFTIGAGVGFNVLSAGGDMRNFYQILALKTDLTHGAFLHVGYNLRNFHEPNYLMLGLGYRFNDLRPRLYRLWR